MGMVEKYWRRVVVIGIDLIVIVISYFLSFYIRFDAHIPSIYFEHFLHTLPLVIIIYLGSFIYFRLYSGLWRYASISDLLAIIKAVTVGAGVTVLGILYLFGHSFPRSVYIIDWLLMIILIGGSRFIIRIGHNIKIPLLRHHRKRLKGKSIVIVGAGDAGEMILREIRSNPGLNYNVVGFIDDDPLKQDRSIHGVHVVGKIKDLRKIVERKNIEEIIIAIASASAKTMREIIEACQKTGIKFKTVPGIGDLINGTVKIEQLREVKVEDLLGREVVKLDVDKIKGFLFNRRILITGAGGSIGSELCRQVAKYKPQQLILLERSENALFFVGLELKRDFPDTNLVSVVADINDRWYVEKILKEHRPQVIFHAAAHKHVPLMESNPVEAIKNNVFGTKKVAQAAGKYGVEEFVMLSTDKAVNPVSFMGVSKRIAELYIQALARGNSKTKFTTVRFGNVLDSEGSVVPIFKRQIAQRGPVTVTHPEIKRYFMTIPEASQLVIQAGAIGGGGQIFILRMGHPVKIVDLAKDIISLSGLEPDEDIKITFVGLRPGEKLNEELLAVGEEVRPTVHEKIMVVQNNNDCDWDKIIKDIQELEELTLRAGRDKLIRKLKEMVPEYQPPKNAMIGAVLPGGCG